MVSQSFRSGVGLGQVELRFARREGYEAKGNVFAGCARGEAGLCDARNINIIGASASKGTAHGTSRGTEQGTRNGLSDGEGRWALDILQRGGAERCAHAFAAARTAFFVTNV